MPKLVEVWRHPIKSFGRERIAQTEVERGKCIPFDRKWAVGHAGCKFDLDDPKWISCGNFSRGAKAPSLQAISAKTSDDGAQVLLSHPTLHDIRFDPNNPDDWEEFLNWARQITPPDARPVAIVQAPDRGMTDTDFASISLINMATHRQVAEQLGRDISHLRWRGNLIVEDAEPWAEFDWIGRTLRIGAAEFQVKEATTRCKATMANVKTGLRDADTLGALRTGWDHQEMGVCAVVTKGGAIRQGAKIELI